ncbi:MAG: GerMN domain-containing protein [Lachnospiraceae bacterium]|nr:GerMN domain-containing protein [Lachnospiraceae bacterium]MDD7176990.1 GerMN domain-containing protein [bacterium]MDY5517498.1 GerMN domain-containing protein [Lachnospiraceae bacterium]
MRKKYILFAAVLLLISAVLPGCSSEAQPEGTYQISYLDKEQTKTVRMPYEPNADDRDIELLVKELIDVLSTDSGDVDYVRPIPEGVKVTQTLLKDDGDLKVYFNDAYRTMNSVQEILCRLALVQTLTQVDGVDCLEFFVENEPLLDTRGNEVGEMTPDDFVVNPGEQINSIQHATLDLYFANPSGDGLILETQRVYYNSNVSLEKLVIEHLLDGPKTSDAIASIPSETALVNVSVADRICYVSLDDGFRTQNYNVQEAIVIYSLVDSLTALPHIDKVQISINGDTSGVYRESFLLSTIYEEDLSYVRLADSSRTVVVNDIKEENKHPLD